MRLVQFKVPKNDKVMNEILDKLEGESEGQRGYVPDAIRERLKALHMLSEVVGESDTTKLVTRLLQGYYAQSKGNPAPLQDEVPKAEEPTPNEDQDKLAVMKGLDF